MNIENVCNYLISKNYLKELVVKLSINYVSDQFENINKKESIDLNKLNAEELSYLLTCSSLFCNSENPLFQDIALKVAQYSIITELGYESKDRALLILDTLTNRNSIKLAEKRNLVEEGFFNRLSIGAKIESFRRDLEYSIELPDQNEIYLNKFQKKCWDFLQDKNNTQISISAPTSAGKSFILTTWVKDFFDNIEDGLIIYVVPTRALINQVYNDFFSIMNRDVNINIVPVLEDIKLYKKNILIFTQERLNIFLSTYYRNKVSVLIVDEAHKIGDGVRGVYLEQAIMSCKFYNPCVKIVFASPFTENPEILLDKEGVSAVYKSNLITVNQNLLWVEQSKKEKRWHIYLNYFEAKNKIGVFLYNKNNTSGYKRLVEVAFNISGESPGNIIYVNGAAEAENVAQELYRYINNSLFYEDIEELIEFSKSEVHKDFLLAKVLSKGIAYHYGNMPLTIKSEIERLFSENKLRFLICTSTLIEGVNLACKNIFVRGPKKGNRKLMEPTDFWNLVGRAGRWGKEFQGNIFCVDSNVNELWQGGEPPIRKQKIKIDKISKKSIFSVTDVIDFINSLDHYSECRKNPNLEAFLNLIYVNYYRKNNLDDFSFKSCFNDVEFLYLTLNELIKEIKITIEIVEKNTGISPILLNNLYESFYFNKEKPIERLCLGSFSERADYSRYRRALERIKNNLSHNLGFSNVQQNFYNSLILQWMWGYSISRIISERISFILKKEGTVNSNTVIREVLDNIERIARFNAPKYIGCYNDVLNLYLNNNGRGDLVENHSDFHSFLEMGVSNRTQLSLISLGLSRSSALSLSKMIESSDYNKREIFTWLHANLPSARNGMNKILLKEIDDALAKEFMRRL
ncbi:MULTISPECIES: DEAD/DEAH box helicase [Acinetobacter]|uniref:DEAD/DEAH box helicase n=1 Tax=Acinetobacter TaxID=469 RepID=UPI00141AA058|nr:MULTISPECIES: DEAD/DEAH box helicase [Acinetobacter]MCS4298924.1 replicative superfamily II helicase [Acinetobacter guillouiae]MCW2252338.1 replicative superfamily II helicase [Acinetobacter sp. BIGb0204]NII38075.1 replicative superfamily II helicase [Acinetobacter sp. BIGb0196]